MNDVEKRKLNVLMAGIEIFGSDDYKNARTDDIAFRAGISKGLLFHYFKNKASLYEETLAYVNRKITDLIMDETFETETDFFKLLDYAVEKKLNIMRQHPKVLSFCIRAYYEKNHVYFFQAFLKNERLLTQLEQRYFSHVDTSDWEKGRTIREMLQNLMWLCDGYMHQNIRENNELDLDALMLQYRRWVSILKYDCIRRENI